MVRAKFAVDDCSLSVSAMTRFMVNDEAQAVTEYALVTFIFAVLMITTMVAIQTNAGSNMNTTQVQLSNEAQTP